MFDFDDPSQKLAQARIREMIVCVHYSVYRGNSLENSEWIQGELRSLPARVQPLAQDYEPDRSAGWLLMSSLEQAVWFLHEYGPDRRMSYLDPHAVAVSPAVELPTDQERLMAWLEDLAFARTVLRAGQEDPYYLVYPEGCLAGAVDVALLAHYAGRGSARLLPAARSTRWDEADGTWEQILLPARMPQDKMSLVHVPDDVRDLSTLKVLVERLRTEGPRQVNLICDETTRLQAERLAHLLVLTQSLIARVVAT